MNLLLELMRLRLNRNDDPSRYAASIREMGGERRYTLRG